MQIKTNITNEALQGRLSMRNRYIVAIIVMVPLIILSQAKGQKVATEGLVSAWTFDKSTFQGKVLKDVWGQNDGIIEGAPKIVKGQINQAIELNGSGDHIALENPKGLPAGDDTYAFEVWFFANEVGGAKGLIGWGLWTGNQCNCFRLKDNGFRHYWWGNDLDWTAPKSMEKNWHHAIAQYDGTTRSLWYDGEMVTSDKPAKGIHNAQMENAGIGITAKGQSNEFFAGMLDDVRVYNRALKPAEVKGNFANGSNNWLVMVKPKDKLASYWGAVKDRSSVEE